MRDDNGENGLLHGIHSTFRCCTHNFCGYSIATLPVDHKKAGWKCNQQHVHSEVGGSVCGGQKLICKFTRMSAIVFIIGFNTHNLYGNYWLGGMCRRLFELHCILHNDVWNCNSPNWLLLLFQNLGSASAVGWCVEIWSTPGRILPQQWTSQQVVKLTLSFSWSNADAFVFLAESEAIDAVVGRPWSDFDDELCKRMASLAIVDGIGLGKCMEKMSRD